MTGAFMLGAVFGLAVLVACRLWWPPLAPLPVALAELAGRTGQPMPNTTGLRTWLGRRLGLVVRAIGVDISPAAADLRITGRNQDHHLGAKALLGLVAGLTPLAWSELVSLIGVQVSVSGVVGTAALLAAAGFVLPDLLLRSEAADRRRDFTSALGSFLDLIVITLAGGSGIEGALRDASLVGQGWAFGELRGALERARLSGESPWAAIGRLGDELGVAALVDLAATVSLAGTEGARVRESLAARAAALRSRQLADAEAEAQSATERLAIPTVLMMTGFVILIGYPAVDAVLSAL